MRDLEHARNLCVLAERDAKAFGHMDDPSVFADAIAGFHAQQAAEKLFKAWLCLCGQDYPRTHDLGLLDALSRHLDNGLKGVAGV